MTSRLKPSLSASPETTAWKASSSGALIDGEIDRRLIRALHQEIEHGRVAGFRRRRHRDRIAVFGDHLEAEILEHRQRCRQRQLLASDIDLQRTARCARRSRMR